jgi:hypothetical protein
MTKGEIREVIDAWAAAAVRLKKGGYDGCDIPFYGGHLIENFLSPLANTRTDEYGGGIENRLRLAHEVLRAVRDAVGKDFIIGVRHSGDHLVPGGLTKEDLLEVARLTDALHIADYWMVSGSNSETLRFEAMVTPSLYHPHALYAELAAPTTADFLAVRGSKVTIITRYFMVGEDIDEGVRSDIYQRLFTQGVEVRPMTQAIEMVPGGVRTKHTFSGAETVLEADTVVLAFGGKANDSLFHGLTGKVPELKLIGDAVSPRRIHDALLEGTRVARAL